MKSNINKLILIEVIAGIFLAFIASKVLHLTAEGEEVHRKTIAKIHSLHDMIEDGITDEERECFYRIISKIKNNMEKNRRKDG